MKKNVLMLLLMGLGLMSTAAVPGLVRNEASIWLDASSLTETTGQTLDVWRDIRGASHPTATTYTSVKPQVIEIADGPLAGRKAVTFFSHGTDCDMQFAAEEKVQTAFFVVDMDLNQNSILLGGPNVPNPGSDYVFVFFRGAGGAYQYNNTYVNGCIYWNDGRQVPSQTTTVLPTGYQLISWTHTHAGRVKHLCNDRGINPDSLGGKRLCEVITFARQLSNVERSIVEGYLKEKWFGAPSQAAAMLEMLGKKAQVHFDASVFSSLHCDIEGDTVGTSISRWDDLSGNNNHLTSTQVDAENPVYGTLGTLESRPVLATGASGSGVDYALTTRLTNTRTVFFVGDIGTAYEAYWLGDPTTYHFARGAGGQYGYGATAGPFLGLYGSAWENGLRVENLKNDHPESPGVLSVFALSIPKDCCWSRLCQDRTFKATTGGKNVAELLTFNMEFSDADRRLVEEWLTRKWGPNETEFEALLARAAVHVDATTAANFVTTDNAITGWTNAGTAGDLYKVPLYYAEGVTYATKNGSYGFTNGVPAFLMGPRGSDIDLVFPRLTNVRSVFWAMDIETSGISFFLGDAQINANKSLGYDFCRGFNGPATYAASIANAGFKNGSLACDGVKVAPLKDLPPSGTHIYDLTSTANLAASALSQDRWCYDGSEHVHRNGGRGLSELLIFTEPVRGFSRLAIREWLASRWTRGCAWAGPGDAEWGVDKYRVVDGDLSVPNDGVTMGGLGFTAKSTVTGGPLTLGAGGIFVNEGTPVSVTVPVAGNLSVNGRGTVALAEPPRDVAGLNVGNGTLLKLPLGGTVAGPLVLQANAKIEFDASTYVAGQNVALTFENLVLLAGGSLLDYVAVTDPDENFLSLSNDGRTVLINDPTIPFEAVWIGGGDVNRVNDPRNWICRNRDGGILPEMTPSIYTRIHVVGTTTFNVPEGQSLVCRKLTFGVCTLGADCDWRGLGTVDLADATVDMDGHRLDLVGFKGNGILGSVVPPRVVFDASGTWYDAADVSTLLSKTQDERLTNWSNKGRLQGRSESTHEAGKTTATEPGPVYDTTTFGRPTVDFGALDCGKDMTWAQLSNIWMGFWVIKIEPSMDAFLLGCTQTYYEFCRGENGAYGHPGFSKFKGFWDGLDAVGGWTTTRIPSDSFRVICAEMKQACHCNSFGNDRNLAGRRGGGRQLSELILFTRALSADERESVTRYLQNKWARINETPAELHLHVPAGTTFENATVHLTGNMMLVKEGAGVYVSKMSQDHLGGLRIVGGTAKYGVNGYLAPLGGGPIVVESEGVMDRNGQYEDCVAKVVLNGGLLTNSGEAMTGGRALISNLSLMSDSTIDVANSQGLVNANYWETKLDLRGHTLTVNLAAKQNFFLYNMEATAGMIKVTSGGSLVLDKTSVRAEMTDFDLNCAMNQVVDSDVHDLTYRFTSNEANGTATMRVHGTFTPLSHYFHNVQLLDGATLDLSGEEGSWETLSLNTANGEHRCTFADKATVMVNLAGRADLRALARSSNPYVITWSEPPTDAAFVPDETTEKKHFRLKVEEGGVRLVNDSGLHLILR